MKGQGGYTPLIHEKREMTTMDMEKAEVLCKFFAIVFTSSQASHVLHVLESLGKVSRSKISSAVREEQVSDCLMKLNE